MHFNVYQLIYTVFDRYQYCISICLQHYAVPEIFWRVKYSSLEGEKKKKKNWSILNPSGCWLFKMADKTTVFGWWVFFNLVKYLQYCYFKWCLPANNDNKKTVHLLDSFMRNWYILKKKKRHILNLTNYILKLSYFNSCFCTKMLILKSF